MKGIFPWEGPLLRFWHSILDMPRYDAAWHQADILAEFQELRHARGWLERWSEMADVACAYTRGRWGSGHAGLYCPLGPGRYRLGLLYAVPKYTSRWLFYYVAGRKVGASRKLTEVRNPRKREKLCAIALRYEIPPEEFVEVCQRLARWWPLLP